MVNEILCLLNDMCRLCLDETGINDIFKDEKLLRDVLLCTGILHISRSDNLPSKICGTCLHKIKIAKDLQEYSTKNDLYMKALLDDSSETTLKIARPKVPLGLNKPYLEERLDTSTKKSAKSKSTSKEKSKISVRCLKDINSSIPIKEQNQTPSKKKPQNDASPDVRQTRASIKKQKCDSSSAIHKTSPDVKSNKNISVEYKTLKHGDKFTCKKCQKTYPTARKLYMHGRSHSKNLYCPLDACGKSFSCKNDLQKHIRSHTGEKPYKCDLCDKSFAQNISLKLHRKGVHLDFIK